jgi:BlaI family penicillinase repressor
MKTKQLNTSELEIMEYLWKLERAYLKDIVAQYAIPKPANTTVSTVLTRMHEKNYIGFEKLGRDKVYFPILKKNDYFSTQVDSMITRFFDNSAASFASFFTKDGDLTMEQLNELKKMVNEKIATKSKQKK